MVKYLSCGKYNINIANFFFFFSFLCFLFNCVVSWYHSPLFTYTPISKCGQKDLMSGDNNYIELISSNTSYDVLIVLLVPAFLPSIKPFHSILCVLFFLS